MSARTVLLVEDEDVVRENTVDLLELEGFRVNACATCQEALQYCDAHTPDLALLDISLPDDAEGGFTICQKLRTQSQVLPIVFLTSHAAEVDRISALRLGADDYITKDASSEYLLIRIRALFKRLDALTRSVREQSAIRDLTIDNQVLVAYWKGQRVDLTLTQFWLLRAIASRPSHIWRPSELMVEANITVAANTITSHVSAIRRKLSEIDPEFDGIRTERGIGYRWVC